MSSNKPDLTTLDLASINALQLDSVADEADPKTAGEERSLARARELAELDSYRQDTKERKKYATRIYWICVGWVGGIFTLLLLNGFGWHFHLSDSVLLAAIGSTTASILGIFYIVVKYLFQRKR